MLSLFNKVILLFLFSFNALMGSNGSVMLCLHSLTEWHLESEQTLEIAHTEEEGCCHHSEPSSKEKEHALSEDEHECVDLELRGEELLQIRPTAQSFKSPELFVSIVDLPIYNFEMIEASTNNSIAFSVSPALAPISISITKVTVLLI